MARRSYNQPAPPRAFMGSTESLCLTAISRMAFEQRQMALRHLTIEDLRQAYVPARLRDALEMSYEVSYYGGYTQTMEVQVNGFVTENPTRFLVPQTSTTPLTATFAWTKDKTPEGFLAMKGPFVVQPDTPTEVLEKLEYAFTGLARTSYEFGLVRHVFNNLNVNGYCNTPQQMRFVWPAIRHIVAYQGGHVTMRELAASLVEASSRAGDKARVPPHITEHLVPTSNIVNKTLLIDRSEEVSLGFQVRLNAPMYNLDSPQLRFNDPVQSFVGMA